MKNPIILCFVDVSNKFDDRDRDLNDILKHFCLLPFAQCLKTEKNHLIEKMDFFEKKRNRNPEITK